MKHMITFILIFLYQVSFGQVKPNMEYDSPQNIPNEMYEIIKNYQAILLGEIHGTNEGPLCALGIVNLLNNNKDKVLLALQINSNEQPQIDKFMSSGDMSILQKMTFFNNPKPDGRSSKAMAELLKSVYGKKNIKVVCFDYDINNKAEYANRETVMAKNIGKALSENKNYKLVCLTGQIHSFIYLYQTNDAQYLETMGYLLQKNEKIERSKMLSLQVLFKSGSAFNNVGGLASENTLQDEIGNKAILTGKPVGIFITSKDSESSVYNGCFFIQKGTASFPLNQ